MNGDHITAPLQATESWVVFENSQGLEIRGTILRFTRHSIFFEIYSPSVVLQSSEILHNFQIICKSRPIYSGRAIASGIVNTGMLLVCEATLEDNWIDLEAEVSSDTAGIVR